MAKRHKDPEAEPASGLLTKAEAAERLGLSERAVARHAAAGRLGTPTYTPKADGGKRVLYHAADVERLREDLAQPREQRTGGALERRAPASGALADPSAFADLLGKALSAALADALPGIQGAHMIPPVAPLTLDLRQASAASGLSRARLREAIGAGELRAVRIGRGWRVRPADLEAYVDSIWEQEAPHTSRRRARGAKT